jgi:curved DNA-binding protein CbpA
MSEENDIRKAYLYLGLEAGTELPEVMTKYKRSVMAWHPDRMPNDPKARDEATEELKKLNWAREVLTTHLKGGRHNPNGSCSCKPANPDGAAHRRNAGPGRQAETREEKSSQEAQAKAKSEERARRAQGERSAQQGKAQTEQQATGAVPDAMTDEQALKDNQLRWRIALGLAVVYIGLCALAYIGTGIKTSWQSVFSQWGSHVPKQEQASSLINNPSLQVARYDQAPLELEQQRREAEVKKKDQDVYFAKLEIDRYKKSIEHGQTLIPDLEVQIANPNISNVDRRKLETYRDFQQKELAKNQENLRYAEGHLKRLLADEDSRK